ncbi:hypothetical protein ACAW74_26025 [Fibrella sp. WM1]|uniref:hypothetical protein n=1 Tax=Fibrella musci TaxID=3242485 RepID=UPI003522EA42
MKLKVNLIALFVAASVVVWTVSMITKYDTINTFLVSWDRQRAWLIIVVLFMIGTFPYFILPKGFRSLELTVSKIGPQNESYENGVPYNEPVKISDERQLLLRKEKYLKDVLDVLKLEVDKDLKKYLEAGDVENANELIADKIEALNSLVETIKGNNEKSLRGTEISSVTEFYESTSNRIRSEIGRLIAQAKSNLSIGIYTSMLAIAVLAYSLLNHHVQLMELLPRAAFSLLIEALAFFFFAQYRRQQEDIKYWNNEKTNLDLKIFAMSIAMDDKEIGTNDYMQKMVSDLIKTERGLPGVAQPKDEKESSKEVADGAKIAGDLMDKLKGLVTAIVPKS